MLPFLKLKQTGVADVIMKNRTPDSETEKSEDSSLDTCAQDLINAIHAKDVKGVAAALKAAMDDSSPEPHSYDAQKED